MRPNARGNLGPSAMAARGTTAPMRLMLRNHRRCQRHFHHLMPRRFGIAGLGRLRQRSLATLTRGGPIVHGLVDPTEWKTSARMTRMTGLSARFAPGRRFAWTLGRLRWIARRRPRGVRRVLLELRFEVPNALLQLGDSGLKRRPHLPDDFIPLPTPRTLRLRRHLYFIGPAPRYTTRESGGVNGYRNSKAADPLHSGATCSRAVFGFGQRSQGASMCFRQVNQSAAHQGRRYTIMRTAPRSDPCPTVRSYGSSESID